MRIRTAVAVGLLAAALTACQPGADDAAPAPTVTVTEPANANAACLAGVVEAYPSLDPETPMMDQVDECAGLSRQEQSDVLRVLQEYDDALQASVDEASAGS
ncbi:hypothetical protein QNO09_12870 [Streptomyces sp. 378]|uniref:hypothetical protein n=1 Tax=Streptomyces sp. 378 TaxID=3049412 RepID=UPI0024C471E2|nr:hypothetical protein [Streptomyces sp. 378]MDK1344179.1 hypothetical protein [Streptomyces sp. 378]